jgi:hypothetical protein
MGIEGREMGREMGTEIWRRGSAIYPIKLFNSQTTPNIHPTVVSPRRLLQLSTKSREKRLPATSAVNRIRAVATTYQIIWRRTICVRIFRGGSSVSAPGRGGRRRRAMVGLVYGGRGIFGVLSRRY